MTHPRKQVTSLQVSVSLVATRQGCTRRLLFKVQNSWFVMPVRPRELWDGMLYHQGWAFRAGTGRDVSLELKNGKDFGILRGGTKGIMLKSDPERKEPSTSFKA